MEYTLTTRAKKLSEYANDLPKLLSDIAKKATLRAIEEAAELTPPTKDSLRGTNTRTGEMKEHWATDSKVNPKVKGNSYTTVLANNKEYASYVNDGHRMDRHFVPGLVINEGSGLLERNSDGSGGIVVGTKTSYVPGLHMTDKAKERYRRTIGYEADKLIRRLEK